MTEAQYNELTACKGVYDFYQRVQTVNSAHPDVRRIAQVYEQLGMGKADLSCSKCVCTMLDQVYTRYDQFKK